MNSSLPLPKQLGSPVTFRNMGKEFTHTSSGRVTLPPASPVSGSRTRGRTPEEGGSSTVDTASSEIVLSKPKRIIFNKKAPEYVELLRLIEKNSRNKFTKGKDARKVEGRKKKTISS